MSKEKYSSIEKQGLVSLSQNKNIGSESILNELDIPFEEIESWYWELECNRAKSFCEEICDDNSALIKENDKLKKKLSILKKACIILNQ